MTPGSVDTSDIEPGARDARASHSSKSGAVQASNPQANGTRNLAAPSDQACPDAAQYDCIFFDLDGTLLPIEMRDFLKAYFRVLDESAGRAGFDTARFAKALNAGMAGMGDHDRGITNDQAFWDVFMAQMFPEGATEAEYARVVRFIDGFYAGDFNQVGADVVPDPAASQALRTLRDKGYPLFLCTMPMFPIQGVLSRLEWAGVDPGFFERITTFDNSTDIKPSDAYYRENLHLAGVAPERVLMVGNDASDDLACLDLGIDAYLITDHLVNRNGFDMASVKHGSLADFAHWVEGLPACASQTAFGWRDRADDKRLGTGDASRQGGQHIPACDDPSGQEDRQ